MLDQEDQETLTELMLALMIISKTKESGISSKVKSKKKMSKICN